MTAFRDRPETKKGNAGERVVAGYLKAHGFGVLASYDYCGVDGDKAPRLMFEVGGLVVPDLDHAKAGERGWLEVKTYDHAETFRKYGIQVHGIKRRHYDDYLAVERATGCVVRLAVLELDTGDLLVAVLKRLKLYPCACRGCTSGRPDMCAARPQRGQVYFNRAEFKQVHRFSRSELEPIRAVGRAANEPPMVGA